jgi:4-amino-4-deoxy-L-arabinose transferase-like glycosyltransferase
MRSKLDKFADILHGMMPRWLPSERALLLVVLAIGVVVRVAARQSVPNGFNNDEASLGYDAYSILKFGVDRHGVAYPAFLIGWGSGMNALAAYLAMPFIAVFGLTEGAVRAVNLLGGLVSLPVFYLLVHRAAGARTALWGVFLLALSPWHIMMSRWALESNLLPSVFLLAVWLLVKGSERARFFLAASLCFALCLYAYGTAYFAVPVFVFLASVYLLWTRGIAWRVFGVAVALFALVATPIVAVIWANQQHVDSFRLAGIGIPRMPTVARYQVISTLFGHHALDHCLDNLKVLWNLLVKQDDGLAWNTIAGYGIVYPFGVALALVGLLADLHGPWRKRRFEPRALMLLWLVVAVALAAVEESNINRINLLWLPLIYFAAVGLRTVGRNRMLVIGLVAVHLLLFVGFARDYFGPYRDRTAGAFYPSYGAAIRAATRAVPGKICVTNTPCFSYAFVVFYDRSDPREFAKTVEYENDGSEFQGVRSFGRFTFGIERCPDDTEAWILDNGDVDRFRDRAARIENFSNYSAVIAAPK